MEKKVLEKSGNQKEFSSFVHKGQMSKLFENIFESPNKGSKRVQLPDGIGVPVVTTPSDASCVPVAHSGYCFRKDLLRTVLAFLTAPHGAALYVTGPTGSGKTSLINEVAARLNWPVQQITCNERLEFGILRGTFMLRSVPGSTTPEMQFVDGPLTRAMREGHILVLNEVDIAPAGEMSAMNDIIEGRSLVIPETGETIKPHPLFRVVVTANTKGSGDETGCYAGTQQQNVAAMDRYRFLEVGYPDSFIETELLTNILADSVGKETAALTAGKMVELANQVRNEFIGLKGFEGTIHVPVSTRCLTTWAMLMQDYFGCPNAMKAAFEEVYLRRCNPAEVLAVNDMALAIFGDAWNLPVD